MADGTFRRSDTSKDGRGAGNKGGWIPQRHVVAHICRKGTWILYAGGGEPWGYSAGCKLMVSPWHDGGWARPKGSAWSMDGVCAGSNGSCHDTRRSLAKTVSPSFPRSGRKSIPSPSSSCPREIRVRVLSCGIRRRVSLPAGPFHALSIPVIDTRGCAKERSKQPSRLWDAKPITFSLFMRGWKREFRNARYLTYSTAVKFHKSLEDDIIVETSSPKRWDGLRWILC